MSAAPAPCFQFAQSGACSYGDRCRFAHGAGDDRSAAAPAPARKSAATEEDAAARALPAAAASRVVLFVAGLPASAPGPRVRRALRAAFAPFRPHTLRLGMTHAALTRGWAHVALPSRAAADAAVAALDGATLLEAEAAAERLDDASAAERPTRAALCTLHVAEVTGKQDTLFPWAMRAQRLQLRLDAVALQCCADAAFGERCASLLAAVMRLGCAGEVTWRVTDGCACAGGSALAFARSASVRSVTAVELDAGRAADLAHNAAVLGHGARISATCGDFAMLAPSLPPCDVLFLDPPWGGASYSAAAIAVDALALSGVPIGALAAAAASRGAAAVALATPRNFDDEGLARAATRRAAGAARHADRALPFRADFGARRLVLLLYPPSAASNATAASNDDASAPRFAFPTALLDALVDAVVTWNAAHGGEHHPRFFDWEKDAWVPLSRWHGARPVAPGKDDDSPGDAC